MADFDRFAEPIAGEHPCGIDCEYDNDFLALTQEVAGKPEQQFGDTVIPAVEPDWRKVDSMARELLERTRDLRVVAWLTLANIQLKGVPALSHGLKLVRSLCENFWDEVHPRVEIDGDNDPYLRASAIASFSGSEFSGEDRIIKALRAATLIPPPMSASFRDVEFAYTQPNDAAYSATQMDSAISDALLAEDEGLASVADAFESFVAIKQLVSEKIEASDAPDLGRLESILKPVADNIARVKRGASGESETDGAAEGGASGGGAVGLASGVPGLIQSREDARRALDRVCEYLEKHEPSNPASLFARRAQRMLSMSFFEIMRELTPDALSHLEMVTGAQAPNEDSNS